jgi:tRNA pseudouridine32 synthase/23S rRNA pseudouridine746 synthase
LDETLTDSYFTPFKESLANYSIPESFTFPFYYEPHPLSLLAVKKLQQYIETEIKAGQSPESKILGDKNKIGKMFGVLVVENENGEVGFISAFSGQLGDQSTWRKFIPPVFDLLGENDFFLKSEAEINELTQDIEKLEQNTQIAVCMEHLKTELKISEQVIENYRKVMIEGRKERKAKRLADKDKINEDEFNKLQKVLAKQSVEQKNQLKELKVQFQQRIQLAEQALRELTDVITVLKQHRKIQSKALQERVFDNYNFLNINGVKKKLKVLFSENAHGQPASGAGDCAAPKLLQYAFNHSLKPIALAEFWWGRAPESEVRQHGNFYGACQGKCQPILAHMLEGMKIDDNPLLINPAFYKTLEIVYEDQLLVIINKPEGLLSVPGKTIEDSVYSRMKKLYPMATGPLIVHRLDMSTSGLMVIALTKKSHKILQQQFIKRSVKKRYVAVLDGLLMEDGGTIDLPLRVDLDDRPRQLVCYDYGKPAKTRWQVIERYSGQTKVYFYPITGRTHQLRVHSAHVGGIGLPIKGDDLYGNGSDRLHLHAEKLEIEHPVTKLRVVFQVEATF